MSEKLTEKLGRFAEEASFESLPAEVVEESKRTLLDTIGCALGGTHGAKGKAGVELGLVTGGTDGPATIIGTPHRTSVVGAAFANGELINDLDFDAVLPPGHVSPYVVPGILSIGEASRASGREIIRALAVSHEISFRFGKSMDSTRDHKSGATSHAKVIGYSATVFGAAAAASMLLGAKQGEIAHALAIAASTSPVNAHKAWMTETPASTIKYLVAGSLAESGINAAYMARLGHHGALQVLDDTDFGYPVFIGTDRWIPQNIANGVGGKAWGWPNENSIKPYPHCRILHAPLHALIELVTENDIKPEEIDAIRAWGEAWVMQGVWLDNRVESAYEAQMSMANGLSVGAHRIAPGAAWQDPALYRGESVLKLMEKVDYQPHPDYVEEIKKNPSARPSRIEIDARGATFVAERMFPKGVASPDPTTFMTNDELVEKFHVNAEGVIPRSAADQVVEAVLGLELEDDFSRVMHLLANSAETA
ncbi:MmgE/PrpD family protein [Pseudarthrobacter sp. NPDC080039]|uniref:MmgE/PrpD family protein n=1 Tax=unclassified Pseudarthrobacter TaxID=2647000 RepID=UPI003450BA9F